MKVAYERDRQGTSQVRQNARRLPRRRVATTADRLESAELPVRCNRHTLSLNAGKWFTSNQKVCPLVQPVSFTTKNATLIPKH